MLHSCSYCGRIHEGKCPKKPIKLKQKTEIDKFRVTYGWQQKRENIAKRDFYLCRICLEQNIIIRDSEIQVHHIIPLKVDFSKRLDDDNLITLCETHHAAAEDGKISVLHLQELAISPPAIKPFGEY